MRRYAARPTGKRVDPSTVSVRAISDPRKFAAKAAVASRTEYYVGEKALYPDSITPIVRGMIASAIEAGAFGNLDKDQAKELVAGFSAHSTRGGA